MRITKRTVSLILSAIGMAGVGVTSWLSVRSHEKAKDATDKKSKLLCYAPAIASGLITMGCIAESHHLSRQEIAALTASCGYLAARGDKIEKFLEQKIGKPVLQEAKQEAAKEMIKTYETTPGVCYERTGKGNHRFLFYEQGRYFCSDFKSVMEADQKFNHDISNGLIPTWNDYYRYLGIQTTRIGEELVIPEKYYPNEWNVDKPVMFDYIDWTDEYGVDVTLIFVDTTVTPLLKEF